MLGSIPQQHTGCLLILIPLSLLLFVLAACLLFSFPRVGYVSRSASFWYASLFHVVESASLFSGYVDSSFSLVRPPLVESASLCPCVDSATLFSSVVSASLFSPRLGVQFFVFLHVFTLVSC